MRVNDAYQTWKDQPSDETYNSLAESILDYVSRLVKNRFAGNYFSTYEEGIGESLVQIYSNLAKFDPQRSSFSTWLFYVVRNVCFNITRDRKQHNHQNSSFELDQLYGREDPNRVESIRLKSLLTQLEPEEYSLFRLKMQGVSDAHIAERMALKPSTVKMRFNRLKNKLKNLQQK